MQLVRFLLVGVCNTAVGLSCIYLAMWCGIDYRWANALGYAVGCVVAFLLNRSWTFQSRDSWRGSFARWLVVVIASYVLNFLTVLILRQGLLVGVYVAQLGGVIVYTGAAFIGSRLFAFRQMRPALKEGAA